MLFGSISNYVSYPDDDPLKSFPLQTFLATHALKSLINSLKKESKNIALIVKLLSRNVDHIQNIPPENREMRRIQTVCWIICS